MIPEPLDFKELHTYSIHDRHSKVTVADFAKAPRAGMTVKELLQSLPGQLAGKDFPELVARIAKAHTDDRPIIVGMGAHVIKVGLNPVLISLMEQGLITAIALNGAGIVHDAEIAMLARTSEEVADVLGAGAFGAARETGEVLNGAICRGAEKNIGLGEAVGEVLLEQDFPFNDRSILAQARKLDIPVRPGDIDACRDSS